MRSRWTLCVLLFAATTLNYLDRQTLSILAPTLQREMKIDNAALGVLFSVFYYTYTVAQFGVGWLLDRTHLRWAFGFAVLGWSIAAGLTGLANTFLALLLFRMLLGVAESANWPASLRIVARALPPKDRPLGNGIFTSGTSVGALIAPSLILGLSAIAGWRWAFVGVASLGGIWFLVWIWFTADPSFKPIWQATEKSSGSTYMAILKSERFWRVFAVTILVNPCLYFNVNWLPVYFAQQRGMPPGAQVATALTFIYLGLDLGYLACGLGVRWLARRMPLIAARRSILLTASGLLLLSAWVPFIASTGQAIATLVVVNFAIGMWISMYLTMAQEVSVNHVSTAAGLLGGSGSLFGAVAMWAVGVSTKQSGNFILPMVAVSIAGTLAALAALTIKPPSEAPTIADPQT